MNQEKPKEEIMFTKEEMELAIRLAWRTSHDVESVPKWVEGIIQQIINNKLKN
jgi:hypothetical protein